MNTVYKVIGVLIIIGGLFWYMQQMVVDYNRGVELAETSGTEENAKIMAAKASVLAENGETQDAIDVLLNAIEDNPKNLEPLLKLAQIYVINCKKREENCEDALWQLNVILKIDSTNAPAKQMLHELKSVTDPDPS